MPVSDFFLADDLSGALDAAAAFHRLGRGVTVELDSRDATSRSADVIGITTETRNASPDDAARGVREAITRASANGGRLLYKKIDSTLRGPIVPELNALLEARPHARVLFCPANPRVGRTVRDGILWVHGKKVAETEFARDPACPVRESSIRVLLNALPAERIVIADAESDDDLRRAVAEMEKAGGEWVGVGSGALATMVAEARLGQDSAKEMSFDVPAGETVMICGSAHPGNVRQAEALQRERGVSVHVLEWANFAPAVQAVIAQLRAGGGASLLAPVERATSAEALRAVTATTLHIITTANVRRMFITGGETGFAVCRALGISALRFVAEIEPGVALSAAQLHGNDVLVAMKPGGFGDPQTWVRAWDALAAR